MSYLIHWASQGLESIPGKGNITLPDKTYNTSSSSLVLTGKGLPNYGLFQQENFLRLLENFASGNSPANPTIGQIWYNTTEKNTYIYTGASSTTITVNGWTLLVSAVQQGGGLSEYNLLANLLNKVIGTPTYVTSSSSMATADSAFGWGQTDLVPVYADVNNLTAQSIAAQASLPGGSTFPSTFSNAAWTILLSRLRKALRQVSIPGITEADTSLIGFLQSASGAGSTTYGNILNNLNAGPTPYQGGMPNYTAGWQNYGTAGVSALLANTLNQINTLKMNPHRFSLSANSTVATKIGTATRVSPTKSLTVPSAEGTYKLRSELQFASMDKMKAYFNAGGKVRLDFSFTPSGVATNLETDWRRFLARLNGLIIDYQGTKWGNVYVPPRDGSSSYTTMGFYGILAGNGVGVPGGAQEIFIRNVLSTLNASDLYGLYSAVPPLDGGVIITSMVDTATSKLYIDIDFYLRRVVSGGSSEIDTTDNSLTGTLKVDVWSSRAATTNTNSPNIADPTYTASGTFITAA